MINSGDIINYNSGIWLSQEHILNNTSVSYKYLRVAKSRAKRDSSRAWQHTDIMNRCYFSYASLPRSVANQLSPVNTLIAHATELQNDISNIITTATYSRYKLFMNAMKNDDLAKSAAVIHEASLYCKNNGVKFSKSRFFKSLAHEIEQHRLKYLPRTWRNLRDKIKAYQEGTSITELVTTKNEGNSNRAIFANNDLIRNWIIELADSQKNYSYAFMWRKLRTMSHQHGIDNIPSRRWVSDFLSKS